ncbi:MAG TPA: UDP-glucose/GDP-mannose dehydrogenase family protein [Acidobacteriota bacterium]|nr:UDP-glucose/GDP-mannose dehydrogenase family protein [Acidobacteriota bacterium]
MNVCVVGTGYVGLVAGTCLADFGTNVTCVDKDRQKIDMLNGGRIPIYEPGLSELIQRNIKLNRLSFSTDLEAAVDRSLVVLLAVGTPEGNEGRADLSQIREVGTAIASCMTEYKVIAIKSTVPVGTARMLRQLIKDNLKRDIEFDVVSNPEFLREGAAVNDFLRPDRIILGCDSERALAIMRDMYRPLYLLKKPIVNTTNETAELIKYAANTMLALRVSFMNEVANLCDRVGADVYDVAVALGMDRRIGPKFLHPGPGFGGSCFPKDVKSLVRIARDNAYDFRIAEAIVDVNARQRKIVLEKARRVLGAFDGRTVTLLGLSFKPDTDDIRESPAMYLAGALLAEGAAVHAYDPAAMQEAGRALPGIRCFDDAYAACAGSDLVIIVTEWNEFRDLDFTRVERTIRTPNLYDTRNIYDPEQIRSLGFTYIGTGRGGSE